MFAKLSYKIEASASTNFRSDVELLLTGTTSLGALSTSINQDESYIISTVASGWTIHDSNAGTGKTVFKSAYANDASKYNYMMLAFSGSSVTAYLYESWDATANTGYGVTTSTACTLDDFSGYKVVVYVIASRHKCIMISGKSLNGLYVLERTVLNTYDLGTTMVLGTNGSLATDNSGSVAISTAPDLRGYVMANTSCTVKSPIYATNALTINCGRIITPTGPKAYMFPMYIESNSSMIPLGDISALTEVYCMAPGSIASLAEFTWNSKSFIVFGDTTDGRRIVIRKA